MSSQRVNFRQQNGVRPPIIPGPARLLRVVAHGLSILNAMRKKILFTIWKGFAFGLFWRNLLPHNGEVVDVKK
jgi:hypothetical protein